jgi:hypothetical protein
MKKPLLVPLLYSLRDIKRLVIFATILLTLIIFAPSKASAQKIILTNTLFVTYQKDSAFSIRVPDYLVEVSDLSADASLQFKNIFNETYLMVVPEVKTAEGHLNLQQLNDDFKNNLLLKGGSIITSQEFNIGNCEAVQNTAEWTLAEETLEYLVTFIDTPQVLYKIYCWTLASQKEYLNDFMLTSNSFAVLKPFHSPYKSLLGSE